MERGDGGMVAMFIRKEGQLHDWVAEQAVGTARTHNMVAKVQGLDRFIVELQAMATDVDRIGQQTN